MSASYAFRGLCSLLGTALTFSLWTFQPAHAYDPREFQPQRTVAEYRNAIRDTYDFIVAGGVNRTALVMGQHILERINATDDVAELQLLEMMMAELAVQSLSPGGESHTTP